jgi:hypothetical protein
MKKYGFRPLTRIWVYYGADARFTSACGGLPLLWPTQLKPRFSGFGPAARTPCAQWHIYCSLTVSFLL